MRQGLRRFWLEREPEQLVEYERRGRCLGALLTGVGSRTGLSPAPRGAR